MRCQRCEFENMPGLQKCMRCGSILADGDKPIDVHPPRRPAWKKPFRNLARSLRRTVPALQWSFDGFHGRLFPDWAKKMARTGCFGPMLSIIPGLSQIVQKRFRSIWLWVVAWLVFLLTGLFLYGSQIGMMILGLAIGIHVWIAVDSSVLKEYEEFHHRVIAFLIILFFYYLGYRALGSFIFDAIPGGYAVAESPGLGISSGDFLLGSSNRVSREEISRGSFVLTELSSVRRRNVFTPDDPSGYAQIVAMPGEKVAIEKGLFVVDDKKLDSERFPVPAWLKNKEISKVLHQDQYFISANYQGTGYNQEEILNVCVISHTQIQAKAFLRWMPLSRRGFIKDIQ